MWSLLLLLVGCDGKLLGEDYEIATGELSGLIDGENWTFAGGETNAAMSDETSWFSAIYGMSYESCSRELPGGSGLILDVPMAPGEYELGPQRTVTFLFADSTQNRVSTTGLLVVDEVGAEAVAGGLYTIYAADADFEVSGQFILDICAD